MRAQRNLVLLYFIILYLSGKIVAGNVVYRFGFDFGFGLAKTSFNGTFNITEDGQHNDSNERVSETLTTTAPILETMWSRQAALNTAANDKLQLTRVAVTQLKSELIHLVDRSSFIASKLELMTLYLNKVNKVFEDNNTAENRFIYLQEFVQLVDDLRTPPSAEAGGKNSLEYTTMKLALERHKLIELQTQILVETLQAVETWQKYSETQLLELSTV